VHELANHHLGKGIQVAKLSSTLSIGAFVTFIRHGDQNLQIGLEVDFKERRKGNWEELMWN
jgi:hypothetical protein